MSSRSFSELAAGALLLSVSACVHVSSTQLAPSVGMLNPDSVRVFAITQPPGYTELAILRVDRFFASDDKVLAALRKRAAQYGANGLLLLNASNAATVWRNGTAVVVAGRDAGTVVTADERTKVDAFERAIAIRFTPAVARE